VDSPVHKVQDSLKDGANGVHIYQSAYFLGIRLIAISPQLIVATA
jgi:hypothetical protein